jgi:IclR family mhp operon transcriptional activator
MVKDIRALQRGFQVLEVLNAHNGSTLTEVTRHTELPKATTYRILENLHRVGYVVRDKADGRYRLTIMVRRLSRGFDDKAWLTDIARPILQELGRKVVYPVSISTLYGTSMLARETTDHQSALALDQYSAGTLLPLFKSASGKVHIAYCPDEERTTLIELLKKSADPDHKLSHDAYFIEQLIKEVREQGYALGLKQKTQAQGKTSALAVPVFGAGNLLASLSFRYIDSAMSPAEAVERYLEPLLDYANRIGEAVSVARMEAAE